MLEVSDLLYERLCKLHTEAADVCDHYYNVWEGTQSDEDWEAYREANNVRARLYNRLKARAKELGCWEEGLYV